MRALLPLMFFCLSLPLYAETATTLDTITVTAEREASPSVSKSISTVDNIEAIQSTHIHEALNRSAGTWISRGNGQEHLTAIRSPVLVGGGGCAPFLMSEDNISLRAPAFCNVNQLFDANYQQAERIEVLRGPGTAFHGSNAMHGIINIIPPQYRDPKYQSEASTKLSVNIGDFGFKQSLIDFRGDNIILQTNLVDDEGYKDDSGYKQQKVRIKFLQEMGSWSLDHNFNMMNLEQETAGYVLGVDAYKDEDLKKTNETPQAYRNAQAFRYHSVISYTLQADSKLLVTPYVRWNEMEFLMHFVPGTPLEENGHHSLGLQSAFFQQYTENTKLTSGFDLDLTTGYLKQTQQEMSFDPFPVGEHYDYEVDVITSALFLQAESYLTDALKLTSGLRYEYANYDYVNNLSDGIVACVAVDQADCRYTRPADDKLYFDNLSPDISLFYALSDKNSAYINLSRGFRTPQTSELFRLEAGQVLADIDSEKIDSFEIGFKAALAESVSYQLSLYQMRKDNVILKTSARQNVDGQKTRHQGVELDLHWLPTETFSVVAALSYAKHQYDSNIQVFSSSESIIKGNIIDTAPRQLHNFRLNWLPSNSIDMEAEVIYLGSYYMDSTNDVSYPGHTLITLRYRQSLSHDWNLAFSVINASDEDFADRADVHPFSEEERYFIGEPRNYRVSVSKIF